MLASLHHPKGFLDLGEIHYRDRISNLDVAIAEELHGFVEDLGSLGYAVAKGAENVD